MPYQEEQCVFDKYLARHNPVGSSPVQVLTKNGGQISAEHQCMDTLD